MRIIKEVRISDSEGRSFNTLSYDLHIVAPQQISGASSTISIIPII